VRFDNLLVLNLQSRQATMEGHLEPAFQVTWKYHSPNMCSCGRCAACEEDQRKVDVAIAAFEGIRTVIGQGGFAAAPVNGAGLVATITRADKAEGINQTEVVKTDGINQIEVVKTVGTNQTEVVKTEAGIKTELKTEGTNELQVDAAMAAFAAKAAAPVKGAATEAMVGEALKAKAAVTVKGAATRQPRPSNRRFAMKAMKVKAVKAMKA
jgi:hypothetical protein